MPFLKQKLLEPNVLPDSFAYIATGTNIIPVGGSVPLPN